MTTREIRVIRHAEAAYPEDKLTKKGKADAIDLALRIGQVPRVVASPRLRAIQTARAFSDKPIVDPRLIELEDPDINTPTAEGYVVALHQRRLEPLMERAKEMMGAIAEQPHRTLIVSHNAVMSGCVRQMRNDPEVVTFKNLEGFTVRLSDGEKPTIKINRQE